MYKFVCRDTCRSAAARRLMAQAEALAALSGLITQRKRADASNWGDAFSLMETYVQMLDLEEPLLKLKVIHVAGTKGKGSTCAFSESILRAHGMKTGMFTSPHLIDVRERFRLNGKEVEEDIFLKHFWWCYDKLQAKCNDSIPMPPYFRFLTLLAFRIFTEEKVEVALLEVGIGGRFDATNVVKKPIVCGVSSLGYDHMELLGNTLGEIAGEKAGIFKANVPAVTSPQLEEAMVVLQKRAKELKIPLEIASSLDSCLEGVQLGLGGFHQKLNAALAVSLCRKFAEKTNLTEHAKELEQALLLGKLPKNYIQGLEEARWPGRAQILRDLTVEKGERGERVERGEGGERGDRGGEGGEGGDREEKKGENEREMGSKGDKLVFFLDGAHTPESMEVCAEWFVEAVKEEEKEKEREKEKGPVGEVETLRRVLLFNCMPERDPAALLPPLVSVLLRHGVSLQKAVVVPSLSSYTSLGPFKSPVAGAPAGIDLTWQLKIQKQWETLKGGGSGPDAEIPLVPINSLPPDFLSSSAPIVPDSLNILDRKSVV